MPPSPSKSKISHKSSGKLFRHKDRSSGTAISSTNGNPTCSSASNCIPQVSNTGCTTIRRDEIIELKDCPLTLPDVSPLDHTKSLLRYYGLSAGDGVTMEELDNLQLELELLLSSILVRHIAVTNQIGVIEQMDKGKLPPKLAASPGKRLKQSEGDRPIKKAKDNLGKARDTIPGPPPAKPSKVKCNVIKNEPTFDVPDLTVEESPKPAPAKNDITNRFWAMVDQYCQEITADDIKVLDELLNTQADDVEYFKIPPIGKHYTLRWAQEDILDEQREGGKVLDSKKRIKSENGSDISDKLLKEVDMNGCNDDVAPLGPLTQRVISGLVEENVLMSENIENKVLGMGVGRPGFIRNLGLGNAAALEKRIKKELQEQGVIEGDNENDDSDDEILCELKRCQDELRSVSSHNHTQLSKLMRLARDALVRHDLKKKLRDADAKVVENYKLIAGARQKKKLLSKKDKETAWKALKEREALVRHLDLLSNSVN